MNPNKAAEPGLVYDMGTSDYRHYLCSVGYNNSAISQLVEQPTICPNTKASILDVNLPSITISNLRKSTTLTRKVTNVGPQNSMYKAMIEPPLGIPVTVRPDILVFNSTTKWKSPPPTRCEHWILFWKPNLDGWGAHCVKSHICEDTVDTILCR